MMKDLIFGRRTVGSPAADAGIAVLRIVGGLALAFFHGIGKVPPTEGFIGMVGGLGFPSPLLFAWLAGIAEFFGGILLALGLITRPTALLVVVHFFFVMLVAHSGDPLADRELPIIFCAIATTILLTGPGRYSLDELLARRRSE